MKIWLVSVPDALEGDCLYWCRSEVEADIAVYEKGRKHEVEDMTLIGYKTYDIKPTKRAFVEFLNTHFTRDNG